MEWIDTQHCIIGKYKFPADIKGSNIAAFDLDDTIIERTTGRDWHFITPDVPKKLRQLIKQQYNIVIISNQKNILKNIDKCETWKMKIANIVSHLKIPIMVICATDDSSYRKPMIDIWDKYINGNKTTSFYCGDAGGLPDRKIKRTYIKKDFSDTDYKFALNLQIKFIHRDEFFYGFTTHMTPPIHPTKLLETSKNYNFVPIDNKNNEIILNVGYPGCGKSSYTSYICNTFNNYKSVNQDTLKTLAKCIKQCISYMKDGYNIVVDNTNMTKGIRQKYIDISRQYNYKIRCFLYTTPIELCKHNNYYRHFTLNAPLVPSLVYNKFNKNYEPPTLDEGYNSIDNIPFIVDKLNITDLYYSYLF
jgi:bifunctional polynucleotide phosphatase/kinase